METREPLNRAVHAFGKCPEDADPTHIPTYIEIRSQARQNRAVAAGSYYSRRSAREPERCGATVYYWTDPEHIAVPVGAFADPNFPAPRVSVWEDRMHPWVGLPDGIEHIA